MNDQEYINLKIRYKELKEILDHLVEVHMRNEAKKDIAIYIGTDRNEIGVDIFVECMDKRREILEKYREYYIEYKDIGKKLFGK